MAFGLFAGCSSNGRPVPDVTIVGNVTYKGRPVPKAVVKMQPERGDEVEAPVKDGKFTVTSVSGNHAVRVIAPKRVLPPRYANYNLSKIEVKVSQNNPQVDIPLR